MYAHAFHKLELKPGSASQDVTIALRRSASVPCQVIGPDGRPVRDAVAISRFILMPTMIAWLRWMSNYLGAVRDGHFAVHGLADDTEVPVYFLDAEHHLGATVRLLGQIGGERTGLGPAPAVRLRPGAAGRPRGQARRAVARRPGITPDLDARHPGTFLLPATTAPT